MGCEYAHTFHFILFVFFCLFTFFCQTVQYRGTEKDERGWGWERGVQELWKDHQEGFKLELSAQCPSVQNIFIFLKIPLCFMYSNYLTNISVVFLIMGWRMTPTCFWHVRDSRTKKMSETLRWVYVHRKNKTGSIRDCDPAHIQWCACNVFCVCSSVATVWDCLSKYSLILCSAFLKAFTCSGRW